MDLEVSTRLGELNASRGSWNAGVKRDCWQSLKNALKRRQAVVLQGLRRTGKTTLARKLAFEEKSSEYFSWDAVNPPYTPQRLDELLQAMQAKLCVIDEIQYVPGWQVVLKRHYDRDDGRRFLATGSASLELDKRSHETLAGRVQTHTLKTLALGEYARFTRKKPGDCIAEYLRAGGFPEIAGEKDAGFRSTYIQDAVLRQFASRDLPTVFPDKNPEFALRILKLVAASAGSAIQLNSLAKTLSTNRVTLASYYHALESGLLVRTAYNSTPSLARQERSAKKAFIEDNAILATLNPAATTGALAENALARHLPQLWFHKNRGEIDFILPDEKLAIELKYQNNVTAQDEQPLRRFLQENPGYRGVLVTKNEKNDGEVPRVPLHEFLIGWVNRRFT
ncbi:MAG: ATP-binding protein [Candidatus Micrarchaeota archaeon]